jgi:hypothetical protein
MRQRIAAAPALAYRSDDAFAGLDQPFDGIELAVDAVEVTMLDDHANHNGNGGNARDEKKLDGGHLSSPPFFAWVVRRFSFSINSCGQEMFRATDMHLLLHYEGSLPGLGVDCPIARPANRVEGAIGIGAMKKKRRCCAHTKKDPISGEVSAAYIHRS